MEIDAANVKSSEKPSGGVLVVDYEQHICLLVREVLSEEGFRVQTAHHGAAALTMLEREQPQMILLDIAMPVMDGGRFAHEYHRRPGPRVPIVVLTKSPGMEAAQFTEEIGANGFLVKPFDLDELVRVVKTYTDPQPSAPPPAVQASSMWRPRLEGSPLSVMRTQALNYLHEDVTELRDAIAALGQRMKELAVAGASQTESLAADQLVEMQQEKARLESELRRLKERFEQLRFPPRAMN